MMKLASLLLGAAVALTFGCIADAQTCLEPTTAQKHAAAEYVAAKFHLGNASNLVLETSEKANDACFWTLHYQTADKRHLTFFLSPDRQFLFTDLMDVRANPIAEEQQKNKELMAALLAGDPPALGPASASVTIVEFSDFECPYCQRLKNVLVPATQERP